MITFHSISDFKSQKKTILTLGTFDGVHLGHKSILDKLNLIGNEKGGMYLFDREMLEIANSSANAQKNNG